ncbi:unnamed protein product [Zymoseptoria tritici ST99CH_3D7]|uniref:Uncharacterized protein n=1 Tax=Zymoseptoria tritici (strain ST99CH_3D7) TaxID=1276538 RepID=A0A1X7RZF8_ZYMT9|nr:unnamed protein product [Zymoseptoria tritici ST99CH_3D7]
MTTSKNEQTGNAVVDSATGAGEASIAAGQTGFDFPALPPELRNVLYELQVRPPTTVIKLYPPRATDSPTPAPALAFASHEIGRESMPLLYQNVALVLRPQPDFVVVTFPRSLLRAMPSFARYVNTLEVEFVFRAPRLEETGNATILNVQMKFEMDSKKVFKMTATADDPMTEDDREKILKSAEKMAADVKALLLGYLKEDAVLGKKLVEAEGGLVFTWTKWVNPSSP